MNKPRHDFEYAPFRKYHTERVKRIKKEFWVRYDHDKGFENLVNSAIVVFGTGFVTIAVMTILMMVL